MAAKRAAPKKGEKGKAAKPSAPELDALPKKELVARAKALGIDGAEKFTRLELIDEVKKAQGNGDRGLLGRARELLKGVVEKGLARASGTAAQPSQPSTPPSRPSTQPAPAGANVEPPVATVTLAEIYAAQGHFVRARAIAREVLRHHPDDAAAKKLLERLPKRAADAPESKSAVSGPRDAGIFPDDPYVVDAIEPEAFVEPAAEAYPAVPSMLDDEPWPARYDVDECVAMVVDPTTLFVYWEVRPSTFERARRALGGEVVGILRVLVVEPSEHGPRVSTRDFDVLDVELGEYFVRDLPAGAVVRAAIGVREASAHDRFLPIAHTLDVEAPPTQPSPMLARDLAVWTEVATLAPDETPLGAHAVAPALVGEPPPASESHDGTERGADDPLPPFRGVGAYSSAELAALRARRRPPPGKGGAKGGKGGAPSGPSSASWLSGSG